jgi:hypothetical protein
VIAPETILYAETDAGANAALRPALSRNSWNSVTLPFLRVKTITKSQSNDPPVDTSPLKDET